MQFNQTNNNKGDVNNTITESGNIIQSEGNENRIQVDRPKDNLLSTLWKKVVVCWKWVAGLLGVGK